MTWTNLSFAYGSILTSTKMTQLFEDLWGMGDGPSGGPRLGVGAQGGWPQLGGTDHNAMGGDLYDVSTTINRGFYQCSSLMVETGVGLSCIQTENCALVWLVRGRATIAGNINLSGQGGEGGTASTLSTSLYTPYREAIVSGKPGLIGGAGGLSEAVGGFQGVGGRGAIWTDARGTKSPVVSRTALWALRAIFGSASGEGNALGVFTGGGGGGGAFLGTGGGNGGNGGGLVAIICDELDFSGSIICDGNNGVNDSYDGGGGGGGGIIICCRTIIADTGSMSVLGGTSAGGDAGGDGLAQIFAVSSW